MQRLRDQDELLYSISLHMISMVKKEQYKGRKYFSFLMQFQILRNKITLYHITVQEELDLRKLDLFSNFKFCTHKYLYLFLFKV